MRRDGHKVPNCVFSTNGHTHTLKEWTISKNAKSGLAGGDSGGDKFQTKNRELKESLQVPDFICIVLVAGEGFEPSTFGL